MVSAKEIQNCYVNMYKQIRNYVWDFNTIDLLANLEAEIYSAFPDTSKLKSCFMRFKQCISDALKDDEELAQSVKHLEDSIDQASSIYCKLERVQEVVPNED